jgi:hypothetical protein
MNLSIYPLLALNLLPVMLRNRTTSRACNCSISCDAGLPLFSVFLKYLNSFSSSSRNFPVLWSQNVLTLHFVFNSPSFYAISHTRNCSIPCDTSFPLLRVSLKYLNSCIFKFIKFSSFGAPEYSNTAFHFA